MRDEVGALTTLIVREEREAAVVDLLEEDDARRRAATLVDGSESHRIRCAHRRIDGGLQPLANLDDRIWIAVGRIEGDSGVLLTELPQQILAHEPSLACGGGYSARMQLFVIRHGVAEDGVPGQEDASRELTEGGERKLRKIVKGLRRLDIEFDRILTSPWKRAAQTAIALQPLCSD